jgi:hypothetical protein
MRIAGPGMTAGGFTDEEPGGLSLSVNPARLWPLRQRSGRPSNPELIRPARGAAAE